MSRLTFNPNVRSVQTTSGLEEHGEEYLGVMSMRIVQDSGTLIERNLTALDRLIKYEITSALMKIGIDLLARSLPRTPWDTGKLRESGTVILEVMGRGRGTNKWVATGNKDGSVNVLLNKPSRVWHTRKVDYFDIEVSFDRSEDGFDVALFTHEFLYPQDQRPVNRSQLKKHQKDGKSFARQPGTGPKYLEIPWNENRSKYLSILREALLNRPQKRMRSLAKSLAPKGGKGEFTVDLVKIEHAKIESGGYISRGPGVGVR